MEKKYFPLKKNFTLRLRGYGPGLGGIRFFTAERNAERNEFPFRKLRNGTESKKWPEFRGKRKTERNFSFIIAYKKHSNFVYKKTNQ